MSKPIVAIVGRPNVGKSTLFNRLVGAAVAITESIPGTTRDRLYGDTEWNRREFVVVDTAGLTPGADEGLARAIRENVEIAMDQADAILFLVDAKEGLTADDTAIAEMLRRTAKLSTSFNITRGKTPGSTTHARSGPSKCFAAPEKFAPLASARTAGSRKMAFARFALA